MFVLIPSLTWWIGTTPVWRSEAEGVTETERRSRSSKLPWWWLLWLRESPDVHHACFYLLFLILQLTLPHLHLPSGIHHHSFLLHPFSPLSCLPFRDFLGVPPSPSLPFSFCDHPLFPSSFHPCIAPCRWNLYNQTRRTWTCWKLCVMLPVHVHAAHKPHFADFSYVYKPVE